MLLRTNPFNSSTFGTYESEAPCLFFLDKVNDLNGVLIDKLTECMECLDYTLIVFHFEIIGKDCHRLCNRVSFNDNGGANKIPKFQNVTR